MGQYLYQCKACQAKFEEVETIKESEERVDKGACPTCLRTGELRRLITGTSFKLAGGGWFRDNYSK